MCGQRWDSSGHGGPSGAFAWRAAGKQPCEELTASVGRPRQAAQWSGFFPEFPPALALPALPRHLLLGSAEGVAWGSRSGSPAPRPLGWSGGGGEEEIWVSQGVAEEDESRERRGRLCLLPCLMSWTHWSQRIVPCPEKPVCLLLAEKESLTPGQDQGVEPRHSRLLIPVLGQPSPPRA